MRYVFDTNVFSQIFRSYYPYSFPAILRHLEQSLAEGQITSPREVWRELANCPHHELRRWAMDWEVVFAVPTANEAKIVKEIFSVHHFQANIERKKLYSGMPNADCFLIARAKALGATVVTLEKPSGSGAKIPDICTHFGVECVSLEEFLRREKWVFHDPLAEAAEDPQSAYPSGGRASAKAKAKKTPSPALLILLILPLFGIFVALLMLALETRQQPEPASTFAPAPPRSVVNFKAPDFELPLLDGVTLVSPSNYAGRPLFLNFWATWCQPCVRELPAFEEFIAEHSADENGPALLTINLGETAAEISGFLAEIGVRNLPIAMDINQVVKLDYGVQNLPTTFVIDGEGRVRHLKLGEMKLEEMEAYLKTLEEPA